MCIHIFVVLLYGMYIIMEFDEGKGVTEQARGHYQGGISSMEKASPVLHLES